MSCKIHILPPEILVEIFLLTRPDHVHQHPSVHVPIRAGQPQPDDHLWPWTLTHVCSNWRQTALGQPSLWNDVWLICNTWSKSFPVVADAVLSRGKQGPLCLWANLDTSGANPSWEFLQSESSNFQVTPPNLPQGQVNPNTSMIQRFIQPHFHRLRVLQLRIMCSPVLMKEFLSLPPGLFPILEQATIVYASVHQVVLPTLSQTFSDCSVLEHFSASIGAEVVLRDSTAFGQPHQQLPLGMNLPWNHLTYIDLFEFSRGFTPEIVFEILSQSLRLVVFKISLNNASNSFPLSLASDDSSTTVDTVTLPDLSEMTLDLCGGFDEPVLLRHLILPSLHYLTFAGAGSFRDRSGPFDLIPPAQLLALLQRSASPLLRLDIDDNVLLYMDLEASMKRCGLIVHRYNEGYTYRCFEFLPTESHCDICALAYDSVDRSQVYDSSLRNLDE